MQPPASSQPEQDRANDSPDAKALPGSMAQELWRLLHEIPGLLSDRLELLSLELERAAAVLARTVVLLLVLAIVVLSAWLSLCGLALALLMQLGMPLAAALGILLLGNLGLAALLALRVQRLLPKISLPATRRRLKLSPLAEPQPQTAPLPN